MITFFESVQFLFGNYEIKLLDLCTIDIKIDDDVCLTIDIFT